MPDSYKLIIDTLRLILFLECNLKCTYCCNRQEQFNSLFREKKISEINFNFYKNICITGGEPFLYKNIFYKILNLLPEDKDIYIYTNGLLINNCDLLLLASHTNIKCINIGLHTRHQLLAINKNLDKHLPVRFMVEQQYYNELLQLYPDRLNTKNLKAWEMDNCIMHNEDWVLLKQEANNEL